MKLFCIPCGKETDHEREATLPPQYRCGDPDYEDRTKCGLCGETYQCPDWFRDAKLGIFLHWGAYAVPAFVR